jgi:hypothetical protein
MLDFEALSYVNEYELYEPSLNKLAKDLVIDPEAAKKERQKIADELNTILGFK